MIFTHIVVQAARFVKRKPEFFASRAFPARFCPRDAGIFYIPARICPRDAEILRSQRGFAPATQKLCVPSAELDTRRDDCGFLSGVLLECFGERENDFEMRGGKIFEH